MPAVRYHRRALIRLGASGLAAAAFLAACGGNGAHSLLSSPPKDPSGKRAGDFRIGYSAPTGDPAGLSDAVYSRLVALDPRSGKVYGDLATGFEVGGDGLTLTVRLRDGLRFHPGAEGLADSLSADNVRRDFSGRRASGDYLFASAIDQIEAPDVHTIVLRLRAPFSLLFDYLADTMTGGIRSGKQYQAVPVPIGSGPFVPAAHEDIGTTLVANPLYYRSGLPQLNRILVIDGGPPRDLAAAVAGGDLHVAFHPSDTVASQVPASSAGATGLRRASRRMRGIGLSLAPEKGSGVTTRFVPAFRDARVRRAFALALDRPAILAVDEGTTSGPVGPAHTVDALPQDELAKHPLYKHDPQQAKQLLAAAGVPDLSFAMEGTNRPQTRIIAQLIEQQLRDVGVQPRTRLLPAADWEQLFLAGDFEVALVELDDVRTPDVGLRLCTSGGLSGKFSLWGYSNPAFDAAARKAFEEIEPRRRGERSREAQRLLLSDVPPLLPLSAPPDFASVAHAVQGFAFNAFEFNTTWESAAWRLT